MNRHIGVPQMAGLLQTFCKYTVLGAAAFAFSVSATTQPKKLLVFDYKLDASWVASHGREYVFVWGASTGATLKTFAEHAPQTVLSKYFPYSRDANAKHGIGFWKKFHADWIQYECDGRTPATMYGGGNISLDINNPKVRQWQLGNFLKLPNDVHEVALDNYQFNTRSHACGHMEARGFIKRYTGEQDDRIFAEDVVSWLEEIANGLHAKNIRLIVNHTPDLAPNGDDPSSPLVQRMVASVDGILDEGAAKALSSGEYAATLARLVTYATGHGKRFYFVYRLRQFDDHTVETAIANYLTMASPLTAVYVNSLSDTYGSEPPNFLGYDRPIGEPCGPTIFQGEVALRKYSQGMVAYMPTGGVATEVPISRGYLDLHGLSAGTSLRLSAGQGRVLYRSQSFGCGRGEVR
ncbi:hypothetical protein ABNK63_03255 [Rhodanobacter sp. IGA1.0]|uniref:Uncharacterized protein n=1 Tax=Rhodanobacter sp. IGA1.0 TaxID=3158582 RepID=A0AAU7QNP7_9GAMM